MRILRIDLRAKRWSGIARIAGVDAKHTSAWRMVNWLLMVMLVVVPVGEAVAFDTASPTGTAAASSTAGGSIIDQFNSPTASARPMTRSWWPDGGAGATAEGMEMTRQHIRDMAAGGFGGMEVAMLSDTQANIPQSATLPVAQQLGQPGVDQNMAQTTATCCLQMSNAQAKSVGFGTENWQKVITAIYEGANSVPGGFVIDQTISQHWPVAFNNIDPNDVGQLQAARTAYSAITTDDATAGLKTVPHQTLRTLDLDNTPFVFVDHYAAATIIKVTSVAANGTPTFSFASLTDVSPQTTVKHNGDGSFAGSAAGVMDKNWVDNNPFTFTGTITAGSANLTATTGRANAAILAGSILSGPGIPDGTMIVSISGTTVVMSNSATASATGATISAKYNINTVDADWGPAPSDPTFTGKVDNEGNRRRMADWQNEYQTTIDPTTLTSLGCTVPAPGTALAAGQCVLYGTWYQGTGQTRSGGVNTTQYNREYVISIYDSAGTQSFINFWENNILGTWSNGKVIQPLGNTYLINLMKANAAAFPQASLFEDSLEFSKQSGSGTYWTSGVLSEMSSKLGYNAARYAPLLATGSTFDSSIASDQLNSTRVTEDWTSTMAGDVTNNHIAAIQDWAKSTIGYNFRVQDTGGTAVQCCTLATDVHEASADSGAADNGRMVAASAALTGSNWVSAESLTFTKDYTNPWLDTVKGLNLDWASGINRNQWHGNPYKITFNGANSTWPGWVFQHGGGAGYGAYDARQNYWGDAHELTDYVARNQAVLQGGTVKVDLAIMRGTDTLGAPSSSSNSFQTLMNAGWSYHLIDDRMVQTPQAVVTGGVLNNGVKTGGRLDAYGPTNGIANGPAYKAIVLSGVTRLKVETVQKLIEYANAGLPVIFYNSSIARVYGTNQPGGSSTALDGNNDTALAAAITTLMANPNVSTVSTATQTALLSQLQGLGLGPDASYSSSGIETIQRDDAGQEYYYLYNSSTSATLSAAVTLKGSGQPNTLDAWTGKITPIANYTSQSGTVTVNVSLAPQDTTIIQTSGVSGNTHVISTSGGTIRYGNGNYMVLRATTSGSYTVGLSSGRTATVAASVQPAVSLSSGWSLQLESWGPDTIANATDPTVSKKTTVSFAANALGSWSSLPATSSQLATLGVTAMNRVSGNGYYNNTIQLPSNWRTGADGANLTFGHSAGDEVVAVTINGTRINTIDQITNSVDVGPYLQAGSNTIQVQLDTNLGNRVGRTTQTYGLTSVQFVPYVDTVIPRQALIQYSGDSIGQTGANLTLQATVTDSAASGYPGPYPETWPSSALNDITKMWIAFDIYPASSCLSGTPTTKYAQVTDSGIIGDGIGTATTTFSASQENSYCVVTRLVASASGGVNQWYVADSVNSTIAFYNNVGKFATGAGWINDPDGGKGNFGFNVRYNNSGKPQGQLIYTYQGTYNGIDAIYVIKSNSITALGFTTTGADGYPMGATLQGKATIQINSASDGVLLYSEGNATFIATVGDTNANGGTGDTFALTVNSSSGSQYKYVQPTSLGNGNIVIHSK